jgi:hypothetical protein
VSGDDETTAAIAAGPPASHTERELAISGAERELVAEEVAALAGSLRDEAARSRYAVLGAAVAAGEVPEKLVADLEGLLELSLGTGRARRLHGADGERLLLRLYQRTPRGASVKKRTDDVNRALSALAGQTLHALSFTPLGPGAYKLEIATDRCQVAVETGRLGVTVDSLGVDL